MSSEGSVVLVTKERGLADIVSAAITPPCRFALVATCADLAEFTTSQPLPGPAAVLVDIDPDPIGILKAMEPVTARFPESRFVVLAGGLQNGLVFEAMQVGARHFLQKKIIPTDLVAVLQRLAPGVLTRPPGQGIVLTVISGSGGAGATSVALNLANEVGLMLSKPTLLVDMDMAYGSLASYLGLKGQYGLGHVLNRQNQIDERLIRSSGPRQWHAHRRPASAGTPRVGPGSLPQRLCMHRDRRPAPACRHIGRPGRGQPRGPYRFPVDRQGHPLGSHVARGAARPRRAVRPYHAGGEPIPEA
jgi:ActR/RegA family two-component response regulator